MADPQPSPFDWIPGELATLDAAGLRRRLSTRNQPQAAVTEIDGQRLVNFSANDYLGLAAHPQLAEAAAGTIAEAGWGAGASPLVTGRSSVHEQLERRLADFEGAEAALLFPSGFAANAGVIPALVDQGDALFGDAKNHASIIDGCRLARAERFIYPHNDVGALRAMLRGARRFRRRLIVTDTLFSMDGDFAPLPQLAELASEHDAMLLVDEAHATGVWGSTGRGAVEQAAEHSPHVEAAALLRVGTLSKAFGSHGGFVVGDRHLVDWIANRARSYVFSTAAPAPVAAAGLAALELIKSEPHRRQELIARAAWLRDALSSAGFNLGGSTSQIIPILIGDPAETMRLAEALRGEGLLVPGIRPPSVPEGESLLRVSLCYGHGARECQRLVDALVRLRG